jgi:hypothetical protein
MMQEDPSQAIDAILQALQQNSPEDYQAFVQEISSILNGQSQGPAPGGGEVPTNAAPPMMMGKSQINPEQAAAIYRKARQEAITKSRVNLQASNLQNVNGSVVSGADMAIAQFAQQFK